jgi:two-component system response regulator MprA
VADDFEGLRQLVSYALRRDGHSVTEAGDGGRAFQLLMTEPFDVAILDVMMPAIDGLALCRMLRDTTELGHLSIIILSAATCEEEAKAAGAHGFLSKPYRIATVRAMVQSLLEATAGVARVAGEPQ